MVFSLAAPAAADYSGDHPLIIYDHDTINGGLVYDTVTDGSKYMSLYPILRAEEELFGWIRPTLYQDLTSVYRRVRR